MSTGMQHLPTEERIARQPRSRRRHVAEQERTAQESQGKMGCDTIEATGYVNRERR